MYEPGGLPDAPLVSMLPTTVTSHEGKNPAKAPAAGCGGVKDNLVVVVPGSDGHVGAVAEVAVLHRHLAVGHARHLDAGRLPLDVGVVDHQPGLLVVGDHGRSGVAGSRCGEGPGGPDRRSGRRRTSPAGSR